MRAVMLLARTGRRLNEILLLDFEPLIAVDGLAAGADSGEGLVAKLRYQQTKIEGAPNTIFVDEEIVAIIRCSQQDWVRDRVPAPRRRYRAALPVHPCDREPFRGAPLHRRQPSAAPDQARGTAGSAR